MKWIELEDVKKSIINLDLVSIFYKCPVHDKELIFISNNKCYSLLYEKENILNKDLNQIRLKVLGDNNGFCR